MGGDGEKGGKRKNEVKKKRKMEPMNAIQTEIEWWLSPEFLV